MNGIPLQNIINALELAKKKTNSNDLDTHERDRRLLYYSDGRSD